MSEDGVADFEFYIREKDNSIKVCHREGDELLIVEMRFSAIGLSAVARQFSAKTFDELVSLWCHYRGLVPGLSTGEIEQAQEWAKEHQALGAKLDSVTKEREFAEIDYFRTDLAIGLADMLMSILPPWEENSDPGS